MRALLLAALACAVLAGCVSDEATCPDHNGATFLPSPDGGPGSVDPRVPADLPVLATGLNVALAPQVTAQAREQASNATLPVERTEFGTGPQRLERLRLQPSDLARSGGILVAMDVNDTLLPAKCGEAGGLTFTTGALQQQGRLLTPGHGAHVWYAGFWENGTLFETNIQAFDQFAAWPKAGWYQSAPYEPLPVYVYDQSRSEEPEQWKAHGVPGTGTPVDGPVGTATAAPGLGYYSTIKGFNDGLKGLSTSGARVIQMDAKDAYPAGTPNNPLAGDNLVFYVRLADVVDQPCPSPAVAGETPCPSTP